MRDTKKYPGIYVYWLEMRQMSFVYVGRSMTGSRGVWQHFYHNLANLQVFIAARQTRDVSQYGTTSHVLFSCFAEQDWVIHRTRGRTQCQLGPTPKYPLPGHCDQFPIKESSRSSSIYVGMDLRRWKLQEVGKRGGQCTIALDPRRTWLWKIGTCGQRHSPTRE